MADAVDVRVHGYPELAAGTVMLAGRIQEEATSRFGMVADQVAGQVNPPRRTGLLAGSVQGSEQGDRAIVAMGEGVDYAPFVEFGGRGHTHNPAGNYLYPTALAAEPLLVVAGTVAAETEIRSMAWPSPI